MKEADLKLETQHKFCVGIINKPIGRVTHMAYNVLGTPIKEVD
jgi:hypothetical protein